MKVREEKVRELMQAATEGMNRVAGDVTVNEVLSAYMTLARSAIIAARSLGAGSESLQASVSQLYLDCISSDTPIEIRH